MERASVGDFWVLQLTKVQKVRVQSATQQLIIHSTRLSITIRIHANYFLPLDGVAENDDDLGFWLNFVQDSRCHVFSINRKSNAGLSLVLTVVERVPHHRRRRVAFGPEKKQDQTIGIGQLPAKEWQTCDAGVVVSGVVCAGSVDAVGSCVKQIDVRRDGRIRIYIVDGSDMDRGIA